MADLGIMRVTFEQLRKALRVPESTRIVGALVEEVGVECGNVMFKLETDEFPPTLGAAKPPRVNATFKADPDGKPVFVKWTGV